MSFSHQKVVKRDLLRCPALAYTFSGQAGSVTYHSKEDSFLFRMSHLWGHLDKGYMRTGNTKSFTCYWAYLYTWAHISWTRFSKNHQKCVLNSVWYCEISLKFSLEKVNRFAWNGVANIGHVCTQFFFKRKVHHTVPCLQEQRDLVWWYWNTTKRSLEKSH